MDAQQIRNILEACLLVAGKAMNIGQLENLFESDIDRPDRNEIKAALAGLEAEYEGRGIELVEVASGWRLQSRSSMEHWVARLFQEKSPRYSRALLETLVLIAYRQPITRGEIEEVRGVAVSSNIIKTLQERDWVKEIGYKDVPGKPALWGTTRQFLDYFNLKRLDELPTLAEAQELDQIDAVLTAEAALVDGIAETIAANDSEAEETEAEETEVEDTEVEETEVEETEAEGSASSNAELLALAGILPDTSELSIDKDDAGDTEGDIEIDLESPEIPEDSADRAIQADTSLSADTLLGGMGGQETTRLSAEEGNADDLESPDIANAEDEESADVGSTQGANTGQSFAVESEIISAHELIIEEWPVPRNETEPSEDSDSDSDSDADDSMTADAVLEESDAQVELRRVIDEFAEEHRLELEDRNELALQETLAQESEISLDGEPSTEDANADLQLVLSESSVAKSTVLTTQLFGATGSVESEVEVLDPETESDVEQPLPEGKNSEP
ncbi:MAG: segregation and condensation protein B [Pseudomonadales bacterium]|jgi:segregation and condensation protein B